MDTNGFPGLEPAGTVSLYNATTTPLGISGVYTGSWEQVDQYSMMTVLIATDAGSAVNGLALQFSTDGKNVDRQKTTTMPATGTVHTSVVISKYFRVVLTNNSAAQTYLRMQVVYHKYKSKELTSTAIQIISDINDVQLTRPVNSIELDYARGLHSDIFVVHKFGNNPAVSNSGDDIWQDGGAYNWLTTAIALRVKAGGDANDDSAGTGARTITIEGLDENWDLASESLTLAGASASAATTTTFIRINRAFVVTCGTYTSANTANIHIETTAGVDVADIAAGEGQTQIGLYSIPRGYKAYLTRLEVEVDSAKSCTITLYKREQADVVTAPFGSKRIISRFSGVLGIQTLKYDAYKVVDEKSDIWAYAIKDSAGTAPVNVNWDLILVKIPE